MVEQQRSTVSNAGDARGNRMMQRLRSQRLRARRFWRGSLGALLAVCLTLLAFGAAFAQADEPLEPVSADATAVTADDGGPWELGVHGTAGNLTAATAAERTGMWYWLNGWFVRNYSWAESTAWEEDFKRADRGGTENYYIDAVDLQFYVGHGSPGNITFHNNTHDDGSLWFPDDCLNTYGDGDNEWLAMTSCQVLANSRLFQVKQCMNRQHLILGFVTNASAHNNYWDTQAYHYGRYLRYGYSQMQSWFNACDVAQRGRTTRVLADESVFFNDNPYWGILGSDFTTESGSYFWYTHACGTASASMVPYQNIVEVPVIAVAPYSLEDASNDFTQLGNAFSVPVTPTLMAAGLLNYNEDTDPPPPSTAASPFLVAQSDGATADNQGSILTMDQGSGLYQYTNLNNLFSAAEVEAATQANAAAANYINQDSARAIANQFLRDNGLLDAGAVFYEVIQDSTGSLPTDDEASAADVQGAEVPTNNQVIYTRYIQESVINAAGASQPVSFTVVGPGAKLKVYVPLIGQVNAAGEVTAEPVGAQGGWRNVEPLVNAATGEAVMTTILDAQTAEALYLALDDKVTMNTLPISISARSVQTVTLAYWESVAGASQGQLIPVYELTVDITDANTNDVSREFVYVPASAIYMRPLAQIVDAPATATRGMPVTVRAADASLTLAENGYAGFDFVMGYDGADGDYIYSWYLDSVSDETQIASCATLTCTFTVPSSAGSKNGQLTVNLVVKDLSSPNQSDGTDAVDISIPIVFLPTIGGGTE